MPKKNFLLDCARFTAHAAYKSHGTPNILSNYKIFSADALTFGAKKSIFSKKK
jgi:hypothetical protein